MRIYIVEEGDDSKYLLHQIIAMLRSFLGVRAYLITEDASKIMRMLDNKAGIALRNKARNIM